jgi:hypothetical protein
MQSMKKKLSLFERVRIRLGLQPCEMAAAFHAPRQWYPRRKNPNCSLTVHQLAHLYRMSGMSPEEFMREVLEAAKVGGRKGDKKLNEDSKE